MNNESVDVKYKLKIIIKTYLILTKKSCTSKQLANFINTHYKFKDGVTTSEISSLMKTNHVTHDVLYDVKDKINNRHMKEYYY